MTSKGFVISYGLTRRDAARLSNIPNVVEVVPIRHIPSVVSHLDRRVNTLAVATVADYASVHALRLSAGRFLTSTDETKMESVCVLGAAAAEQLFPSMIPVGESVTIRGHNFKVIGVLKRPPAFADADRNVYVPFRTSFARFGEVILVPGAVTRTAVRVELNEIVLRVTDHSQVKAVADGARHVLEKAHIKQDWDLVP